MTRESVSSSKAEMVLAPSKENNLVHDVGNAGEEWLPRQRETGSQPMGRSCTRKSLLAQDRETEAGYRLRSWEIVGGSDIKADRPMYWLSWSCWEDVRRLRGSDTQYKGFSTPFQPHFWWTHSTQARGQGSLENSFLRCRAGRRLSGNDLRANRAYPAVQRCRV